MILPIYLYGHPFLYKKAQNLPLNYPCLSNLLDSMFETLHNAEGVGIAAPQIGIKYRVFAINFATSAEKDFNCINFKKVFINPKIIKKIGNEIPIKEGCLSIPGVCEKVIRNDKIQLKYFDENFQLQEKVFVNHLARIIQHEYDHLKGILFTNHVMGIRKQMIRTKLNKIMNGKIQCSYRTIRFFK